MVISVFWFCPLVCRHNDYFSATFKLTNVDTVNIWWVVGLAGWWIVVLNWY